VKVKRHRITNEDEYEQNILENNFFSKSKLSFCLVQQVTPDDIQKYFIFGIKFDDFYITNAKKGKNIFVYEKTYLFIAYEPLCLLFENIFQYILNIKKLNFFNNLDCYESLENRENLLNFEKENDEIVIYHIN
jgi:hypothetical protein